MLAGFAGKSNRQYGRRIIVATGAGHRFQFYVAVVVGGSVEAGIGMAVCANLII